MGKNALWDEEGNTSRMIPVDVKELDRMPLSALLSQVLVAFTIEFDNEFEYQVPHRTTNHGSATGSVPWLVSRVMWSNFMQFVNEEGTTIRDLRSLLRMSDKNMRIWLTRMEVWWGYIVIKPQSAGASSKRIHPDAVVLPTAGGRRAQQVWRTLDDLIEKRWRERFGEDTIDDLRQSLSTIVSQLDVELLDSLPVLGYGLFSHGPEKPLRAQAAEFLLINATLSLPSLLSRVLLWFAIEFEQAAEVSLAISANILRLLSEEGIPLRDLPRMAAVSKEAVAMAMTFLTRRGYVLVASKPGGSRGKILLLTPKGRNAQEAYSKLVGTIEQQWQTHFGDGTVRLLRDSLTRLVGEPTAQRSPLFRGLETFSNGWRASVPIPEGLPHYPMVLHRGGFPDGC